DAAGNNAVLSARKKYGANRAKLRNRRVAAGAETAPSCAAVRAGSMSVGGVAGAVPPPHAATRTGTTATHANVGVRESGDAAASDVVAGKPQDWGQRESVAR